MPAFLVRSQEREEMKGKERTTPLGTRVKGKGVTAGNVRTHVRA